MADKQEIRKLFKELDSQGERLTAGQSAFIASTKKYFTRNKLLSEKQLKALYDIQKNTILKDL